MEPESGLEDTAHVLDVKIDELYNVVLNFADVIKNKNTYYMMQLLESDKNPRIYWVFRKWGRMGTDLGDTKLTEYSSVQAAKKEFAKTYKDKTGNEWEQRNSFQKQPGKFMQIDVDYSADTGDSAASAQGPYKGPLPKATQDLINLICDTRMMNSCLMEMEIDTKKMPLGKLSKKTIKVHRWLEYRVLYPYATTTVPPRDLPLAPEFWAEDAAQEQLANTHRVIQSDVPSRLWGHCLISVCSAVDAGHASGCHFHSGSSLLS